MLEVIPPTSATTAPAKGSDDSQNTNSNSKPTTKNGEDTEVTLTNSTSRTRRDAKPKSGGKKEVEAGTGDKSKPNASSAKATTDGGSVVRRGGAGGRGL